jgi:hypothetical protein
MTSFYFLQISSTLSVLLPFLIGIWKFSKYNYLVKMFVAFLGIGFLTDVSGWYLFLQQDASTNMLIRTGYDLIESCFLLWFTSQFITLKKLKLIISKSWIIVIPAWLISIQFPKGIEIFETTSQMIVSFISSFCILQIIEKQGTDKHFVSFVLLIGIFFYCFCTFFFQSLLTTQIGLKIWFLHNIINIITNLIYFWGFTKERVSKTNF